MKKIIEAIILFFKTEAKDWFKEFYEDAIRDPLIELKSNNVSIDTDDNDFAILLIWITVIAVWCGGFLGFIYSTTDIMYVTERVWCEDFLIFCFMSVIFGLGIFCAGWVCLAGAVMYYYSKAEAIDYINSKENENGKK